MNAFKTTKSFCKELNQFFHQVWLPKNKLAETEWQTIDHLNDHALSQDWSFTVFDPEEISSEEQDRYTFFPIGKSRFGIVLSGAPQTDTEVFNFLHHISGTNFLKRSA